MIVFGTGLYGSVDKVPGLCRVATKFVHVWYVPLFPTESWIVFAGSEKGNAWRGIRIALSGKSVLMAYFRAALFGAAAISWFRMMTEYQNDRNRAGVAAIVGVAALVGAILPWRVRASHARARELAAIMKLDPAVVDKLHGARSRGRR